MDPTCVGLGAPCAGSAAAGAAGPPQPLPGHRALGSAEAVTTLLSFCPSTHPLLHPSAHPIPLSSSFPSPCLAADLSSCLPAVHPQGFNAPPPAGAQDAGLLSDLYIYLQEAERAGSSPASGRALQAMLLARAGAGAPKATSTCCHQRGWGAAACPHLCPGPSSKGSAAATEGTGSPGAHTALTPWQKTKLGGDPGASQHWARLEAAKLGAAVPWPRCEEGAQGRATGRGGEGWARSGRSTRCPGTAAPARPRWRRGDAGGRQFLCVGGQG